MALYARASTTENQNPETQLVALRDFARFQGFEIAGDYVDHAPANDLRGRTAWRRLLDDGVKRRFAAVVVFRADRAFRSVKHMHDVLSVWQMQGIHFVSAREAFDTHTAPGRLLLNLLASLAEFELEVLRERVKAGMDRARRQGKHVGRPGGTTVNGFQARWAELEPRLRDGSLSVRQAARLLGVSWSTVARRLRDAS